MKILSKNLKFLLKKFALNPSELARLTGLNQPVVHRLVAGSTDNPRIDTISPIADFFSLHIDQLIGRKPLPSYLFENGVLKWNTASPKIPLLKSHQVMLWLKTNPRATRSKKIIIDTPVSEKGFALPVEDASMQPHFSEGSILVIDPTQPFKNNDFVVAHIKGYKKIIFKQLVVNKKDKYLKPLNPQFRTMPLNKPHQIIGVVIQVRNNIMVTG